MYAYWWCLICEAHGSYAHTAAGEMTAIGTPARHTKDTGHLTTTSLHPRPGSQG